MTSLPARPDDAPYRASLPEPHPDNAPYRAELPEPRPNLIWAAARHPRDAITWRKIFPGTTEHVADARRLAGLFLNDTPHADDAAWIVGELAANAVLHSASGAPGGHYVLELLRTPRLARLLVCDLGGGSRPTFTQAITAPPALPEGGYGLRTILRLAIHAGVRGTPATGHAVWADLPLT
ncbi:ATP-binding protein [Thermopolyspora sp. NPDC052614]|uniref:ATP-binding protein n=1 Tax=Thermopolyspora sp. NPDC052614 TaxID=3155682 RepID=UPI003429870F